ncbi:GNAT family N-acetyltransferase [Microcoleus sp. CAWBG58]|uniref:GNAT family N-acetyltransferase n=1 Tax=Microcoleus sp. CAWBG58 TaxID=2841651 RepID=UPI0025F7B119|nr:GNAT family N-acetyltransferase [Microcoleus sp. CAWBG58]
MTATTISIAPIASYSYRLATATDAKAIAPLWQAFAAEREAIDPSMLVKPNFDFEKYVTNQIEKPLCFCWLSEHSDSIIGCLFIYYYDEAPPASLPEYLIQQHDIENPFQSRRVGSVLGMYVQPEHRKSEAILMLAKSAIDHAKTMKVSDIDLLIAADQTGIQAILQRAGFTKAAVQYTRHHDISTDAKLPSLHPPHPEFPDVELPTPRAIPLRHPETNELLRDSQGKPIFLIPLVDDNGELLKSSNGQPIYPELLLDPATNSWVIDGEDKLVTCPILRDENGQIAENQNMVLFSPPAYDIAGGQPCLMRDAAGNYVFQEVERDRQGKIVKTPDGFPVFKQPKILVNSL